MLSVFPTLFSWSEVSPLLIRLTLGSVFIIWSYGFFRDKGKKNAYNKALAGLEIIAGLLLIIGLWTQIAALFLAINLVIRLYFKVRQRALFTDGVNYYFILLVLALSLLVTGPGLLAFDYKL